ncbi:MAG TPA: LysR family transcriptional regulator [Polyangiaceae bacterium]|nr:LysR family transcriptional regulator [Polyangiaceae bacterium]
MPDPLFEDLRALLCFTRVVERRSFTKAAAALGVSKSVVSGRVAMLEARLGEQLLLRTTRQVTATDAGLRVYSQAAQMVERAAVATKDATDVERGVLRVSAPVTFAQMYLAVPLAAFMASRPGVRVELLLNDRFVDLTEERIDVAIRVTDLKDSGLIQRRLSSSPLHICGAPGYLKQRGRPTRPEDLLRHDCLRYSLVRVEREWRLHGTSGPIRIDVKGTFETSSGTMLREAAVAGIGLAVVPRFMIHQELAAGTLETVLDDFAPRPLGIYAVRTGSRSVPRLVKALVDALEHAFRTPPWL